MTSCGQCATRVSLRQRFCPRCHRFLVADRPLHLQQLGVRQSFGVVVALWIALCLIGSCAGVGWLDERGSLRRSEIFRTKEAAEVVQLSGESWRRAHGGACPTVQQLVDDGFVRREHGDPTGDDVWGRPFRIECKEILIVRSDGRDGVAGTDDDVELRYQASPRPAPPLPPGLIGASPVPEPEPEPEPKPSIPPAWEVPAAEDM